MSSKQHKILLFSTVAIIWLQSAMPPDLSSKESGWIFQLLFPPLAFLFGPENVTKHLIRKMAHFIEYSVLGCILSLNGIPKSSNFKPYFNQILYNLNFGLIVAFLDESIQILSGRGYSLIDVWLDLSGLLTVTSIAYLLSYFRFSLSRSYMANK